MKHVRGKTTMMHILEENHRVRRMLLPEDEKQAEYKLYLSLHKAIEDYFKK